MSQVVQCPGCKLQIKVKPRLYGRKVNCKCGMLLRMPLGPNGEKAPDPASTKSKPPAPLVTPPAPSPMAPSSLPEVAPPMAETYVSPVAEAPIRFQCPTCSQTLEVEARFAGQVSQCPCGTNIRVPEASPLVQSQPLAPSVPSQHLHDPFAPSVGGEPDPFMMASSHEGANSGGPAYLQPGARKPTVAPRKKRKKKKRQSPASSAQGGSGEVIAGIGMMVGAVVWFVGGLYVGLIFYYPPILFFIGLASVVKGMMNL